MMIGEGHGPVAHPLDPPLDDDDDDDDTDSDKTSNFIQSSFMQNIIMKRDASKDRDGPIDVVVKAIIAGESHESSAADTQ